MYRANGITRDYQVDSLRRPTTTVSIDVHTYKSHITYDANNGYVYQRLDSVDAQGQFTQYTLGHGKLTATAQYHHDSGTMRDTQVTRDDGPQLNWNSDDGYQLPFTLKDRLGGVICAIRNTKQTGDLVGGSDHIQKGRDILGKLKKVRKRINNSHGMSDSERSSLLNTVNHHIDDLTDALK